LTRLNKSRTQRHIAKNIKSDPFKANANSRDGLSLASQATGSQKRRELVGPHDQLASILDHLHQAIVVVNRDQEITIFNQGAAKMFGYTAEEILGQRFDRLLAESSNEIQHMQVEMFQDSLEMAGVMEIHQDLSARRKDESLFSVDIEKSTFNEGGEVFFTAVIVDVTSRQREGERLIVSERQYRRLFESAKDGILILDAETGMITDVNPFLVDLLGYSREVMLERYIWELGFLKDILANKDNFLELRQKEYIRYDNLPLETASGRRVNVEFVSNVYLVNQRKVIQCNVLDITERKRAEEQIIYQAYLLGNISDAVIATDENLLITSWNGSCERIYGWKAQEVIGKPTDQVLQAEFVGRTRDEVLNQLRNEGEYFGEVLQRTKDGLIVTVEGHSKALRDESGKISGFVTANRDITDRKRADAEVKRLADEFKALYETAYELTTQHDTNLLLQDIANRAKRLLDAGRCGIHLHEAANREFVFAISTDSAHPAIQTRLKWGEGLVGKVAEARETIIVDHYSHWEHRRPYHAGISGMESVIGAPMIYRGELLGVITVGDGIPTSRKFTQDDAGLLSLFAEYAASAVHHNRLLAETQQNLRRVKALHQIDQAICSNLDLAMTMNLFLLHASTQLVVDAADVLLLNPITNTLEFVAGIGFKTPALQHTHLRLGFGLAGRAALERKMITIPDLKREIDGLERSPFIEAENFVAYRAAPLISKGKVNGVLEVFHRRPVQPDEDWNDFVDTLAGQAAIAIENALMFENLQRSNADLSLAYDATIEGWSRALDLRDNETEGHTLRVTELSLRLARSLGIEGAELVHFRRGALLHDIGKMGVPDAILFKPEKLSQEEWQVMMRHPDLAIEMLSPIAYLKLALDIPYCHHEKWDGTGYPRGLEGAEIPLAARIFSVVDVWDALRSDRPYRPAWEETNVLEYLRSEAGKYFDPRVVETFLRMHETENSQI
jgi:PAS domain S-box-containing protein/putative nucleotidyltransferase with HDIG domain